MPIVFNGLTADIVSSTMYETHDKIVDGLYRTTPFLDISKRKGKIKYVDGGSTLVIPIQTADQTDVTQITTGWEPLNMTIREISQTAQFNWARFIVPVAMNGKELSSNKGERAIFSLADARRAAAIQNGMRQLNRQIVKGGTALTDVLSLNGNTGDGGAITGFLEANDVGAQSNLFGGLARGSIVGLNNQFIDNAGSSANLIRNLQLLETRASTTAPALGDGGRFHLTLASMDAFTAYRNLLFTQERFVDAKELDASGVSAIAFSSGVMMPDRDIVSSGTTAVENSFMCLNLDGVYLEVIEDFVFSGLSEFSGYDGWSGKVTWQGQLAGDHLGSQGLLVDAV